MKRKVARLGLHSWLLRTPTLNLLIDTCIGADKERGSGPWSRRQSTRLLDELAAQGLQPEDIDFVACTHLHGDHVGWNTRLEDGRWVPTFPRARYGISAVEVEAWARLDAVSDTPVNYGAYRDSILPIVESGQALYVGPGEILAPGVEIVPLPGHTLSHFGIEVDHGGDRALFCGDALHSPVQLVDPRWPSMFCEDRVLGIETRVSMLDRVVDERMLLLPAHFRGARAVYLKRQEGGFLPL
ncbi:MAG: MBL fold metallo-hydrolase [Rhizorhabdus sp.]